MKAAWITDPHLNLLSWYNMSKFFASIPKDVGCIFITGDIADAPSLYDSLDLMDSCVDVPVYFVLGNHDFYHGDVHSVRQGLGSLPKHMNYVSHKTEAIHIRPGLGVALVGADGWADGGYGDYFDSPVRINDSRLIRDLQCRNKSALLMAMRSFAWEDVAKLHRTLSRLADERCTERIIILTHVPPFAECALFEGVVSDDDHLPFFASKIMGDMLLGVAKACPHIKFQVYCGHTHHEARYMAYPNLIVDVGHAEYRKPSFKIIEV